MNLSPPLSHTCLIIWTLIFGQFPIATAKTWCGGLVLFGSQSGTAAWSRIENWFLLNIWLLHTRKCQFNQSWSCIQYQRVMSRYRGKEERMGTCPCIWQIKVVHKVLEVMSLQLWQQVLGNHSHTGWYCSISSMELWSRSCHWNYWGSSLLMCLLKMTQRSFILTIYVAYTYLHISDMTMDVFRSVRRHPQVNEFLIRSWVLRHNQTCTHHHSKFWQSL